MRTIDARPHGANVTGTDGVYWVYRHNLQRALHNAETFGGTAQVVTGVAGTADQIRDALDQIREAANREAASGAYRGAK
jgi:hypothetical protein